MKHVNQPIMNKTKKMVENNIVVEKEQLITKKDMTNKEILREKNLKIIKQYSMVRK